MKTNIRAIPATRVASWVSRFPDASPFEWDEDGGHFDGVRLADGKTYLVATQYTPTATQIADAAATKTAQDTVDAKAASIIADARAAITDDKAIINLVNAGTLTNAQRDSSIKTLAKDQKALARAVLYLAKGETSNT